jgi:GTP-binding protein
MFKADNGESGGKQRRRGKDGDDLIIEVPSGTSIVMKGNQNEVSQHDLIEYGQKILLAKGGKGGLGNVHFKTSTNQAPTTATEGTTGEEKQIVLELKLVSDIAIIGYPNTGKSTLLAAISSAKPQIDNYPFTTRTPIPGMVIAGWERIMAIEIPAIVEGAHEGRGIGNDFLRHAERTKCILLLLDGSSPTPVYDMEKLVEELERFNPVLVQKPRIVVVNKMDLPEANDNIVKVKKDLSLPDIRFHAISALTGEGIQELIGTLIDMNKAVMQKAEDEEPPFVFRPKPKDKRG